MASLHANVIPIKLFRSPKLTGYKMNKIAENFWIRKDVGFTSVILMTIEAVFANFGFYGTELFHDFPQIF